MNLLKSKKGMTLVEIVVALAVLGILVVPILSMFDSSISQIFNSGFRTTEIMKVQKIADELQKVTDGAIETYFISNYSTYQLASSPTDLTIKKVSKDGNYYITTGGIYGPNGWEVTILKFYKNGTRSTQITTFVPGP